MIRAFLAIPLPDEIKDALDEAQDDLRGANWVPPENLHLTLSFLGDQTRRTLEDLDALLMPLTQPRFELEIAGVSHFGGRDPRLCYAGLRDSLDLRRLQAKVEQAARDAGIAIEDRRYTPHVTLARWARREVTAERLQDWVERNNLLQAGPFTVESLSPHRTFIVDADGNPKDPAEGAAAHANE
ncbi:MAG: RNA 2',3'-cyclic phosphodiesterase, partial [Rhodobacteraceae bacterium]|nr:RNA 2',3'-cyclic phosphodiesterase [Paracoccaceae bacterium]